MSLASTCVFMVEQKWLLQHLCHQRESQLLPASPGDSLRSASGSDPGFFQITGSVLELKAYEVLHSPFKSRVSVSYSPPALSYASSSGLQYQIFWGLIFPVQDTKGGDPDVGLGTLMWGSEPSLLGENLCTGDYPPICGSSPQWSWLAHVSFPSPHFAVFPSLVVENLFCQSSGHYHQ